MQSDSEDEDSDKSNDNPDSYKDEVYGEMGATVNLTKKRHLLKYGNGSANPDEQSINSYSIKSMKAKDRKPRR